MRLECIEAFAEATVRVLTASLGDEFGRGTLRLTSAEERLGGVGVRVRITGQVEGRVVLNLDEATALRIFNRVTGEGHAHVPAMGLDYFRELGNVISGGAVSALNELGFAVTVHPPEMVVAAPGHGPGDETEACQIPVYSPYGALTLQVVLRTQ